MGRDDHRGAAARGSRSDAPPRDRREAARAVGVGRDTLDEALFRVQAACDQRCLFCSADPAREPVTRDVGAALAAHPAPETASVVLSGGEPLVDARLPQHVAAALAAGATRVMIQTNGMRLTEPAVLDGLAPYRDAVHFLVSLHAHRADVSDVLTRTRGGWERTVAGIDAALATGSTVWLNHVLNTLNVFEFEAFVRFVRARFPALSLLVVSFVNPTFRAARNPWLMPPLDAVGPPLRAGLAAAAEVGLAVAVSEVCGVPLCVVRGHEATHDAWFAAPARPQDARPTDGRPDELPGALPTLPPDRVKGPDCPACRWHDRCQGVWRGYAERHGFRGLDPVPPPGLRSGAADGER